MLWILAFLLIPKTYAEVKLVECRPQKVFSPCTSCTRKDYQDALAKCEKNEVVDVRPSLFFRKDQVNVDLYRKKNGFGNQLSIYYTAVGLCMLTGLLCHIPVFSYHDITLTPYPKLYPNASVGTRNTAAILHYCTTCPHKTRYFHECPGMWMLPDIRSHLRTIVVQQPERRKGILIQYRCGWPSHSANLMGLLPFEYYSFLINREKKAMQDGIAVLPDPGAAHDPCCEALMHGLVLALAYRFQVDVEILKPRTLKTDFAQMISARVLIASASTFGFFSSVASYGTAYVPVAELLMNGTHPCIPGVKWVSTNRYFRGCSSHVLDWFVRGDPELQQHLATLFGGPWYNKTNRTAS